MIKWRNYIHCIITKFNISYSTWKSFSKKIKLKIPAGADDGYRLRMRGQGSAGPNNGPKGDLYIVVNVKRHEIFQRQDNEIILDLDISPSQAVLGESMRVPTLAGNVKLKIPSGTQTHKIFRMKNQGIAHLRGGGRGDLHVRVVVETPTKPVSYTHLTLPTILLV